MLFVATSTFKPYNIDTLFAVCWFLPLVHNVYAAWFQRRKMPSNMTKHIGLLKNGCLWLRLGGVAVYTEIYTQIKLGK